MEKMKENIKMRNAYLFIVNGKLNSNDTISMGMHL